MKIKLTITPAYLRGMGEVLALVHIHDPEGLRVSRERASWELKISPCLLQPVLPIDGESFR
jgi:hypothetical protein